MSDQNDPFYIGYLPLPSAMAGWVKLLVAAAVLGAVVMAGVVAMGQKDPGTGQWNDATTFAIEGHLSVKPYPLVFVDDPESEFGSRAVILVSAMKFGAAEQTTELDGHRVRAKGQFISRDGRSIFELSTDDDAVVKIDGPSTAPSLESLGEHKLVGEITDSKCYLSV